LHVVARAEWSRYSKAALVEAASLAPASNHLAFVPTLRIIKLTEMFHCPRGVRAIVTAAGLIAALAATVVRPKRAR
jgi:hypothetical protein